MYLAFVKRALDLLFALIVSPIVLLVLAVLAIAIKIEDRGPVIYRASRMGRAGQPFTMYKLRSMKVNAP
ncbi:MAG: sugar transferase, partial [Coriobacteriales bacterium]|nr:sugar transferase [Coriobacteriales bacterium]